MDSLEVNKAVNASIHPLQDQITQLLTALNRHLSLDRATPTPLINAVRINYLKGALNSTLWDRLISRYCSNSSSSEDNIKPQKDNYKCYNCNKISYIAIQCPKPRRSGPKKVKKVEKAKRREESSNSNAIEELGSSKAEESSGKE
ncbi:hypothetical protein K456DRAFT_55702 [Colletotrichum gloeosporioides 23]|nr:hypothetical protein K456DRAFT_55702 [Colletotrichum gloeosporioides 23]